MKRIYTPTRPVTSTIPFDSPEMLTQKCIPCDIENYGDKHGTLNVYTFPNSTQDWSYKGHMSVITVGNETIVVHDSNDILGIIFQQNNSDDNVSVFLDFTKNEAVIRGDISTVVNKEILEIIRKHLNIEWT